MKTAESFVKLTREHMQKSGKMSSQVECELRGAVSWNDTAKVKAILRSGGTPSENVLNDLISQAANIGNIDILKHLLRAGARADGRNKALFTPLHLAIRGG